MQYNYSPLWMTSISSSDGVEEITAAGYSGVDIKGSVAGDYLLLSSTRLVNIGAIRGGAGDDTIWGGLTSTGTERNDEIWGEQGNDSLYGGGGNDVFYVSGTGHGFDTVKGEAGNDRIEAAASNTCIGLKAFDGVEVITAGLFGGVYVSGDASNNNLNFSNVRLAGISYITGGAGNDTITGSVDGDDLRGGVGNDTLYGMGGKDTLRGEAGSDWFAFSNLADSTVGDADLITDFSSLQGDKIHLSSIDANTMITGNQAFVLLITSGDDFTGTAGELRYAYEGDGRTHVYGDIDGDAAADFEIALNGNQLLSASDFYL